MNSQRRRRRRRRRKYPTRIKTLKKRGRRSSKRRTRNWRKRRQYTYKRKQYLRRKRAKSKPRSILKSGRNYRKRRRKSRRKVVRWGGALQQGDNIPLTGNAAQDQLTVKMSNMTASYNNAANNYDASVKNVSQ